MFFHKLFCIFASFSIPEAVICTGESAYALHSTVPKDFSKEMEESKQNKNGLCRETGNWKNEVAPEGETYTIELPPGHSSKLTSDAIWFQLEQLPHVKGSATPVTFKVTVSPNKTGIIRKAVVTETTHAGEKTSREILQPEPWKTRVRAGDPNARFDESRMDPRYRDKMEEWKRSGRRGGIPKWRKEQNKSLDYKEFCPSDNFEEIVEFLNKPEKGKNKIAFLKKGEYSLGTPLCLREESLLVGENKEEVILRCCGKGQISLSNAKGCGVRDLTIKGAWSGKAPVPGLMKQTFPSHEKHCTIDMRGAVDSYVDNVNIIHSASHPIWISGSHNTIRDVFIDGAYNKGGGCQGYFFISGNHQLITGCDVTHVRHISFQNPESKQNVFYKNDIHQEVSFHTNDGGDILIEHNRITVPSSLDKGYHAVMGPWSSQHKVGGKNFVYRNKCLEKNHDDRTPWSDQELYIGPWEVARDFNSRDRNFRITEEHPKPSGRTLYPIILE